MMGQFAIHIFCMWTTVNMTRPYLPANWAPNPEGTFEPNLINSVVFLVTCVQQVNVFVVNYKGLPFMQGLTENSFLMWSLSLCGMGAFVAASNVLPVFNGWLQLTAYPSDSYQTTFFTVLVFNMVGTLLWDRLMLALFAPQIFAASMRSLSFAGVKRVVRVLLIIAFLFYLFRDLDLEEIERLAEEARVQQQLAEPAGSAGSPLPDADF